MGADEGNLQVSYGCRNDNGKFPNTHLRCTYILTSSNYSVDVVERKI